MLMWFGKGIRPLGFLLLVWSTTPVWATPIRRGSPSGDRFASPSNSSILADEQGERRGLATTLSKFWLPTNPTVKKYWEYVKTVCGEFGLKCAQQYLDEDDYADDGTVTKFTYAEKIKLRKVLPFFARKYAFPKTNCCYLDCYAHPSSSAEYRRCEQCQTKYCPKNPDAETCNIMGELGADLYVAGANKMLLKATVANSKATRLPKAFKDQVACWFPNEEKDFLDDIWVYWGVPPLTSSDVQDLERLQSSALFSHIGIPPRGFASEVEISPSTLLVTGSPATTYSKIIFMESANLFDNYSWGNQVLFEGRQDGQCQSGGGGQADNKYWQMELLKQQVTLAYLSHRDGNGSPATFGRKYYKELCKAGSFGENYYEATASSVRCRDSCLGSSTISYGCLKNHYKGHFLRYGQTSSDNWVYEGLEMKPEGDDGKGAVWKVRSSTINSDSPYSFDAYFFQMIESPNRYMQRGGENVGLPHSNSMTLWTEESSLWNYLRFLVVPSQYGDPGSFCLLNIQTTTYLGTDHTTESNGRVLFKGIGASSLSDTAPCGLWETFAFYSFSGMGLNLRGGGINLVGSPGVESSRPLAGPANKMSLSTDSTKWGGTVQPCEDCVMQDQAEKTPCCDGYQIQVRDCVSGVCAQSDSIELIPCTDTCEGCAVPPPATSIPISGPNPAAPTSPAPMRKPTLNSAPTKSAPTRIPSSAKGEWGSSKKTTVFLLLLVLAPFLFCWCFQRAGLCVKPVKLMSQEITIFWFGSCCDQCFVNSFESL